MKQLLGLTLLAFLSACAGSGGSGNSSDPAGIPSAIIGSWEISSMSANGQTIKPEKPSASAPDFYSRQSDWAQLKVDKKTIALISTDFVDYWKIKSPYKVEGNKIATTDTETSSMTDFIVHSYTQDSLTLEFVSEGETPSDLRWVFKRIKESQLATKSAQAVSFTQKVSFLGQQDGQEDITINLTKKGRTDFSKKGLHDSIRCSLTNEDELRLDYTVFEVKENSVGSSSEFDSLSYKFNGLKLGLKDASETVSVDDGKAEVTARTGNEPLIQEFDSCRHRIKRKGAVLTIESSCGSSTENAVVELEATCLLSTIW